MRFMHRFCLATFLLLSLAAALPATAATRCVTADGSGGCFGTINAAIAASSAGDVINVGPGTYAESVTVGKSLSLVADRATIDARGQLRGIFVDGLDYAGLSGVRISGFTLINAYLEGILVLNASNVAVSGNTVMRNNLALTPSGCSMLPPIEPGEAQDCGEGIHLQAVDHSIVTNNIVHDNAGGILISDDTGGTHDNLISFNNVYDNAYACGITMASHVQATASVSLVPLGVYHNTVYGNRARRSGLANGGGSGIGIFASIPGTKAYGNVVVNNLVSENGLPGIALHAHAPNQNLNDNMIVGNTVLNNAADTADAFTSGPTGINLYSLMPATGNIISGNMIQGEAIDVAVRNPALVQVQFNNLSGLNVGVQNFGVGAVDATQNFWGCGKGPTQAGSCSMGLGNSVTYAPWLLQGVPPQPTF